MPRKKKTYKLPEIVESYNIENSTDRAIAGSELSDATKDINIVDENIPGSGVSDSGVVSESSSSSSSTPSGEGINNLFSE